MEAAKKSQKVTFMSKKISKRNFYVRWDLFAVYLHKEPQGEKSQKVTFLSKKNQKVTSKPDAVGLQHKIQHVSQVEAAGWGPDAVRLEHKIQHVSHG